MNDPVQNPYIAPGAVDSSDIGIAAIKDRVRIGMIITFALVQGVVFATGIMLFLMLNGDDGVAAGAQPAAAQPAGAGDLVLPGLGIAIGVGACVAALVVGGMMKRISINHFRAQLSAAGIKQVDHTATQFPPQVDQLINASRARTIVGQAILEGAAMLNVILMFLDDNLIHLVPIGVLIAGIVMLLPTVGKKLALVEQASSR
ncbi:hypothetical protein [Planctomycetes bacterium K23_9]|uniref:Uncharacterized protein n=1 Tax=Stieleria marina TaxID=1930275 RepID=A0A517NS20_9BACT|nr:hypothetical protein K239x_18870 [Planctomycetes bacterium K23_9]